MNSGAPTNRWKLAAVMLALGGAMGILHFFAPTQHAFYPRCALYQTTGLACPGCGCLRAMHELSHGHFGTAFGHNPVLILLLPVLGWYAGRKAIAQFMGTTAQPVFSHPAWAWALFGGLIAFTIARNLPFAWARYLGP